MLTSQNSATKKRPSQSERSVCTYCSRSGLVHNSLWGLHSCKGDRVGRVEKKMGVGAWRWLGGGRRREEVNFGMGSPPDTKQTWHPQLLHCLSSQCDTLWHLSYFPREATTPCCDIRDHWFFCLRGQGDRPQAWTLSTIVPSPSQCRLQNHCCCISLWSSLSDGDKNWSNQALFSSALA